MISTTESEESSVNDSRRAFFDTNVLVYAYGDTDDDRHSRAVQLFETAIRTRSAVVSTQVLPRESDYIVSLAAPVIRRFQRMWSRRPH